MSLAAPKDVASLCEDNKAAINLLRTAVERNFPDLSSSQNLNDGTKVDDLFYLRYVLSSKDQLTSEEAISNSKTLQHVLYAIEWRNTTPLSNNASDASLVSALPVLRTGELRNGFPMLFLPVRKVDLEKITGDKAFEQKLMDHLLNQRRVLFNELDEITRNSGKLMKTVTVYDLKGISYGQIFKLKSFFKLVQAQGKVFKKLFPQCTELTVFVNAQASYLLKGMMTSSKQKVMSSSKLLAAFNCHNNIPDWMGGSYRWPQTKEQLLEASYGRCQAAFSPNQPLQLYADSNETIDVGHEFDFNNKKLYRGKNKKRDIGDLERQMVRLKKNRLFSIDVLDGNQTVNLFFTNLRQKDAHVLVVIKQKNITCKKNVKLPSGFSQLPLKLSNEGEVMVVYLDTGKAKSIRNKDKDIEKVRLKKGMGRKLMKYGKKKIMKKNQGLLNGKGKGRLDLDLMQQIRYQCDMDSGIKPNKVFFRFEVTDSVVCGSERDINEQDVVEFDNIPVSKSKKQKSSSDDSESISHFEAASLTSRDSICADTSPSLLKSAYQILTAGWY